MLGRVKTRLARDVGAHTALQIYHRLLRHSVHVAATVGCETELWAASNGQHPLLRRWAREADMHLRRQRGLNLGQRMLHGLRQGLTQADAVVLIGSDCPGYSPEYIGQAFDALRQHPVVIGPSTDGGYVLIGVRRVHPALFQNIAWGSDQVLSQTRARLSELMWSWAELAPLSDIDTAEDWAQVRKDR